MLVASLSYAIGGVYAKRTFAGIPALSMAIGQQLGASATLVPLAAVSFPKEMPSLAAILSVLVLSLLCTAAAYLLYFYLIENAGPTKTFTVTFLIPAFGLLFGVLFLGEPIGPGTFIGMGIILSSVALVTGVSFGKED
jgi:drug/metabolite transporter (DMT)-like permease